MMITESRLRLEANIGVTLYIYVWRKAITKMSSGINYTYEYTDLKFIHSNLTALFWIYNNTMGRGLTEIDTTSDFYANADLIIKRLHNLENKYLRSSGTDVPVLMYVTLDGNPGMGSSATLLRDVLVQGVNMGSYSDGMIISKGTDFTTFVEALMRDIDPPDYDYPYLLAYPTPDAADGYLEVGSRFVDSTQFDFTREDAGLPTHWRMYRETNLLSKQVFESYASSILSWTHEHPDSDEIIFDSEDDFLEITAEVDYAEGIKTKLNSIGIPDPTGYIQAGTVTQKHKYMAKYPVFALFTPGQITVWTDELRAKAQKALMKSSSLVLEGQKNDASSEFYFSCLVPPGYEVDTLLTMMWPDGSKDKMFHENPKGSHRQITVAVGETNIDAPRQNVVYDIYDVSVLVTFSQGDDYTITIKKS